MFDKLSSLSVDFQFVNLQDHINTCDYGTTNCPNPGCFQSVQRRNVPLHLAKECQFRLIKCEYCPSWIPHFFRLDHQEKDCQEIPCSCENNCGLTAIPRCKLAEHYSKYCPNTVWTCPFSFAGCCFKGTKSEVKDHIQIVLYDHIHLAAERTKALEADVNILSKRLNKESAKAKASGEKVAKVEESLTATRNRFLAVECELKSVKEQLEKVERNNRQLKDKLTQFVSQDVHLIGNRTGLQPIESTSYNGTLKWKLDDFTRRFQDAVAGENSFLLSPPFCTSPSGYRMCSRIYLNGDGMGQGSHISLFFVLMRGEWDRSLPFPFQRQITLKLLDQGGDKHIVETFLPDPHSSSFRRPVADMNAPFGYYCFVAHDTLLNGSFIRDDNIYIVISVDTSGLPAMVVPGPGLV